MDSRKAHQHFQWQPTYTAESVLTSIATHAEENPDWLAKVS
jgi:hypothetical protein